MTPRFFDSAADFRRWLEKNHAVATELWVGFHKKGSGRGGLTYAEAVDEALCFGWIDGIIRRIDAERYTHRFTPRKPSSIWSLLNVNRAERLIAEQKMHAAGLAAYAIRTARKTGIYAFERRQPVELPPSFEKRFRARKRAWAFFERQPAGYRRLAIHRVMSPKREKTRERWLERLITASAAGQRLDPFAPTPEGKSA